MRWRVLTCALVISLNVGCASRRQTITVGSKNFPEQAILGEIIAQLIEARTGMRVQRRFYLAGTYICQQALLAGRIDMYAEYTGTALTAVLKERPEQEPRRVFNRVRSEYARRFNLTVEPPLGFNDSFAIVIRRNDAQRDHIQTVSDAVKYAASWRAGFGYEFMERPDGYEGFVKTYGLKFAALPRIMDLGLLYRALTARQVDIVAGNTTDGQLMSGDFTVLADDKHYFPPYDAIPIIRSEVAREHPDVTAAILELAGKISGRDMQQMNREAVIEKEDVTAIAHRFLQRIQPSHDPQ